MSVPDQPWPLALAPRPDGERPSTAADDADGAASLAEPSEREASEPSARPQSALARWFHEHFDAMWRLAARLGVPREHVDDVVQEAFITADRRARDIAPGAERRFLMSVTVKLAANQRRRRKTQRLALAEVERTPPEASPSAEQLLARKQLRELLDLALAELNPEQRAVFVLHELEGCAVTEIATLLEIPLGTAASRLARAREKFSKAAARLRPRWSGSEEP